MSLTEKQIDFMGVRKIAGVSSIILVIISIISLAFNSLEFGLDFTSGTSVRLSYSDAVVVEDVNQTLRENDYDDAVVVTFGSDRDIRILLPVDENIAVGDQAAQAVIVGESIAELLQSASGSQISLLGSDYVSAKVGGELVESGGIGMLVALAIIMVYIAMPFSLSSRWALLSHLLTI